jgi:hypothetical protein
MNTRILATIVGSIASITISAAQREVREFVDGEPTGNTLTKDGAISVEITNLADNSVNTIEGSLVDLRTMGHDSLESAMTALANGEAELAVFERVVLHSKRGVFKGRVNPANGAGYGTYIAKGKKPLTFDFSRIDCAKMKTENGLEAVKKALYAPKGGIALISTPLEEAPAAEAAVEVEATA